MRLRCICALDVSQLRSGFFVCLDYEQMRKEETEFFIVAGDASSEAVSGLEKIREEP